LVQSPTDISHVPWQQLVYLLNRMIGDPRQLLSEVILGIEPVQLRRLCRTEVDPENWTGS
jgi:hypothetical protein